MVMTRIVGRSAAHLRLLELASSAAANDAEVLIRGPSGVGKELYARLIHEQSARAQQPFVPVHCGALPPDLFERELSGHAEGAFTGTLFLDEVGSLPLASQVKLLGLI